MKRKDKTKEELLEEIALLQKRIAEIEITDIKRKHEEEALLRSFPAIYF